MCAVRKFRDRRWTRIRATGSDAAAAAAARERPPRAAGIFSAEAYIEKFPYGPRVVYF